METTEIRRALERYSKSKWPQTTDGVPSTEELRASDAMAQLEELEQWIKVRIHEEEEHNKLIRVCSPLVKEEDGSDLTPNWYRVHNALTRLVSERNDYKRELNRMIDAYRGQVTRFGAYGEEIDAALMTVKKHEPQ